MIRQLAQVPHTLGGNIQGEGLGPFGRSAIGSGAVGLVRVTQIVSSIIGVMTIAAGIWFMFNFLIGGLQYISSAGDKHALEEAQKRITNAFIGLIIVVAGWTILALAGKFLGYDILISNPANLIQSLGF